MILIGIEIICWAFVIIRLINGRKIEKEVNNEKRIFSIVIFTLFGALIFIKTNSIIGSAAIVLAGLLYSVIPSGYNNEGIYIKGRKYSYKKITSADINEERKCYRLTFVYRMRPYFISVKKEERYILEDVIARYRRGTIL